MAFPIDRKEERTFSPEWAGQVLVVDIDRTYLATRFSRIRDLARIPFERAEAKEDIAGMARLLVELRHGPTLDRRETPLYFVSASPKQLRPTIERKLALDGITYDGTTFKDWASVLKQRRPLRSLRKQLAFKLTALLTGRLSIPAGANELLLGDDLESDPLAYALYADVLADRIPIDVLADVLRRNEVLEPDADDIVARSKALPRGRGVSRAFIRLERHTDPDDFLEYAPGVLGCTSAFQMAAALWKVEAVSLPGVARVALSLRERGVDVIVLQHELDDLVRRAIVLEDEAVSLYDALVHRGVVLGRTPWPAPDPRWLAAQAPRTTWTPARLLA